VLYGCLNDISFDLQCEGSRELFMYNLALQYEDYNYFLQPAIEKFLSVEVCDDWHLIKHLCDFIELFVDDYGDASAKNAIETKYNQIYGLLMSLRWSVHANEVSQCYEYMGIVIIENSTIERAVKIFEDMGKFFIRRRRADDDELKGKFLWFWHCTCEKYGEKYLAEKLDILSKDNVGIRRFRRVMFREENYTINRKKLSADEFIECAENNSVKRKDIIWLRRAERSEKMKIAQALVNENNLDKKAELLKAFTASLSSFPLEPEILTDYAVSENKNLRKTAVDALLYVKADCVHDFAVRLLEKGFSLEAVLMLINNYRDSDKKILLDILDNIEIDYNKSGWHNIILSITNKKNIEGMPEEAVMFVYEKSMCSCCREDAVLELIRRNLFTEEIRSECLWDCNSDIRKVSENNS
ncbi:MAG: hypothetical protein K2O29_09720, partial [Ruminococcus sp.]|nr:hypothetical protein [Ruminococcus sp.]